MSKGYGIVIYRQGDAGVLEAEWHADGVARDVSSPGRAVPKGLHADSGFAGDYVVTYCDPDGHVEAVRDLEIRQEGGIYHLKWLLDQKTVCTGVGFETGDGLIVSYVDV